MSTIYEIFGRDAHAMTIALMERAEVITAIPAGASVALKPNLVVAGQPEYGATTHAGVLSGTIEYLREHIYQLGLAIEDGCEVIGYNPWSFTDLLSTGNGMAKRYGLVYIDTTDEEQNAAKSVEELSMKRIPKDSFYWYSKLVRSNGKEWGKEMLK